MEYWLTDQRIRNNNFGNHAGTKHHNFITHNLTISLLTKLPCSTVSCCNPLMMIIIWFSLTLRPPLQLLTYIAANMDLFSTPSDHQDRIYYCLVVVPIWWFWSYAVRLMVATEKTWNRQQRCSKIIIKLLDWQLMKAWKFIIPICLHCIWTAFILFLFYLS